MKYYSVLFLALTILSCQNRKNKAGNEAIARVNDSYLYPEDIKKLVPENSSKDDSVSIVNNHINTWATRQLFIDKAKLNLSNEELSKFDQLVENYRSTLFVNEYKNAVINKSISMEISDQEIQTYFDQNFKNFNLNEDLVKLRYLHLPADFNRTKSVQRKFTRFNENDSQDLKDKKSEYISYSFKDSVWIKLESFLQKKPILKKQDKSKFLRKGNSMQLIDSTGVFMIKVINVLKRNDLAPIEYITPTIRKVILNKRKLELIKKIEKDITRDAVENKQFEIYE